MKKILLIALAALILPGLVFAQGAGNGCSFGSNGAPNVGRCVNQIYVWSLGAAGMLAMLMIVIGGYTTLTAAGNAERASRGKGYITSSLIGLVLIIGAYILLRTINPDLVDFNLSCVNNLSSCGNTAAPGNTAPGN